MASTLDSGSKDPGQFTVYISTGPLSAHAWFMSQKKMLTFKEHLNVSHCTVRLFL